MYIKVKVQPNSKKELFDKTSEDTFAISVKEKPIQNMANKRVIELLTDYFSVSRGDLKIISGHRSPSKIINVEI